MFHGHPWKYNLVTLIREGMEYSRDAVLTSYIHIIIIINDKILTIKVSVSKFVLNTHSSYNDLYQLLRVHIETKIESVI